MASMLDALQGHFDANTIGALARQIGASPQQTASAVQGALPMILGGLARNAQSPSGAAGLFNALGAHDGGLLDDLSGFLGGGNASSLGGGILGHIFGGRHDQVAAPLGRSTGLSMGQISQLLAILAPIVMGFLGRQQRTQGLDPGGLADALGHTASHVDQQNPGLIGALGKMLDANGDGNPLDDLMQGGGGLLGSLFGGNR
jgi:hypothetical protein